MRQTNFVQKTPLLQKPPFLQARQAIPARGSQRPSRRTPGQQPPGLQPVRQNTPGSVVQAQQLATMDLARRAQPARATDVKHKHGSSKSSCSPLQHTRASSASGAFCQEESRSETHKPLFSSGPHRTDTVQEREKPLRLLNAVCLAFATEVVPVWEAVAQRWRRGFGTWLFHSDSDTRATHSLVNERPCRTQWYNWLRAIGVYPHQSNGLTTTPGRSGL
jgi:hypothetical protein